jgi:hypothetical protein
MLNIASTLIGNIFGSNTMEPTGIESVYDITATKGDGTTINMADLKGKVVYATNVASK